MNSDYLGIAVLAGLAALIAFGMVCLSWILGPKKVTPYKAAPYECGVAPVGDAKERFPIKFYLVAIVFILFDIEAVFLWGFYTAYKTSNDTSFVVYGFFEFLGYMATWILAYVYVIRVGAIDWDETTELAPGRLRSLVESSEELPVITVGGDR